MTYEYACLNLIPLTRKGSTKPALAGVSPRLDAEALQETLNSWASDGWELMQVVLVPPVKVAGEAPGIPMATTAMELLHYFRRVKPDQP